MVEAAEGHDAGEPDLEWLVQEDRVHGEVYTSDRIFQLELERIFHRWWVYVAHESEIAEPGDYVLKWIGRKSIIVSRSEDGGIHLLANRCSHRGSTVCQDDSGSANYFRCQYHGWTFQNDGTLAGVPFPSSYGNSFDKAKFGLTPVPRTGVYRGFVFGSLSPDGMPFEEYLAPVSAGIDAFLAPSPTGRISLSAGCQKSTFAGNWKFVGQDGYHPSFTHRSIRDIKARAGRGGDRLRSGGIGDGDARWMTDKSPELAIDLGNGHARLDRTPAFAASRTPQAIERLRGSEEGRRYLDELAEVHGADGVAEVLTQADPHMTVWPNLMVTNTQVRVTRPLSAGVTETLVYPAMLDGVPPSVNADRLRTHEAFHGPAGFGAPDDYEIFERNQVGLAADLNPWVFLGRGLATETVRPDGSRVGGITDETPQRGQLRQWKRVMAAGQAR